MGEYRAVVDWRREEVAGSYSRAHRWRFDGGAEVPASAAPQIVRPPLSDPAGVDPEEAFVAAISSCHMLFFLSLAEQAGYRVASYRDDAVGLMEKGEDGKVSITCVTLRPAVAYEGKGPNAEAADGLHHSAHERCFIANSVRSEIRVEPA